MALEMARMAFDDGIRKIVATPHVCDRPPGMAEIEGLCRNLNRNLEMHDICVEVLPGAEVSVLSGTTFPEHYAINGSRYVLVEFPSLQVPPFVKDMLFGLGSRGFVPIIAHPERNAVFLKNPEILFPLLESGALVQITADSLAGSFGMDIKRCAAYYVTRGIVSIIASDAHSVKGRAPRITHGLKMAQRLVGKEQAGVMVKENPEAIVSNREVRCFNCP